MGELDCKFPFALHYQSLDDLFKVRIHRVEDDYSQVL